MSIKTKPLLLGYSHFLGQLKSRINAAHVNVARSVNKDLIHLYWDIGEGIVEKQRKMGWGDGIVETLAKDLQKAFPGTTGFSVSNLWRMRQFFTTYSAPEFLAQAVRELKTSLPRLSPPRTTSCLARSVKEPILAQAVRELLVAVPWGQHVEVLNKVKIPQASLYYLRSTSRFGWSRNVLLNQIKADAFERSLRKGKDHNFPLALPRHLAAQADEALKSSYNLEFLGIGKALGERALETRLIDKLRDFILELGYGFCFVGRQHRLTLGSKEYFVDLLFYHRFLKALVAVELKTGPFAPEYAGKMDFYLNLLNQKEKAFDDRPSIGIILCAEKDSLEVKFSLKTKKNPIGVAEYQLLPHLPKRFQGKLPSGRELMTVFKR